MNMWCHLPTGFKRRHVLQFVVLVSIIVALITTIIFASVSKAAQSTNKTINFQGRLLTTGGAIVADGHYNMQFKIYQDGAGTTTNNPGGSLEWTESYVNNNEDNGVLVKNGLFSVSLGSLNSFGASVDWNQDTLWLSMNVAGNASACATFGTAPCAADGEMLPMKRITATPYAINAGAVGGKTADNFVQLAQGVQTDASSNTSSIYINKTGSGNLIQLQNTADDVFTVGNAGDLTLGNNADKTISVAKADDDTEGKFLTINAGRGGDGEGNNGGDIRLQGGDAGGTNANGGNVHIDAGAKTGSGMDGYIDIGANHARDIVIGSTHLALSQNITIGANETEGSVSDVLIGAGGTAAGGSTTIRAKDAVTIETNGTTRATFSDTTNSVYFGNGVSASTPNDFTIQGTDSSATAVAGGSLTVQGGNATTGNANGGNVTISGGTGSGSGANGLVVLTTPTFSTVTNDAGCYASGAIVASSCTIAASSVNNSSAVLVGFSAPGQTAALPDPTITTAGRIIYIMAAGNSEEFVLSVNGGGTGNQITMRKNTASTMLWNGSDWIPAGGSSTTTLQDAYNNTPQNAGAADLVLDNSSDPNGLTIRNSDTDPINGPLLEVQSATASTLFSVNSNIDELASNPGAETAGGSTSTFPANTWNTAASTVTRQSTPGDYVAGGKASVKVTSSGTPSVYNTLKTTLEPSKSYNVSLSVRVENGSSFTNFYTSYMPDDQGANYLCSPNTPIVAGAWQKINCTFQTPDTEEDEITVRNNILIEGAGASGGKTFYIDNLSVTPAGDEVAPTGEPSSNTNATSNVQVGGGAKSSAPTLFTLDKSASAPTATNHNALLGSMYYDTTLGKVQCYESEGWGQCGDRPDTFVTLTPEYAGSVVTAPSNPGTFASGFCSDALNVNDGSSGQPTVCGTNESNNFYELKTSFSSSTNSVYVTYKLPSDFKEFVASSTSLTARTTKVGSSVAYQIYRKNQNADLTACGSSVTASTGVQTAWQIATASGSADPSTCSFAAGDSIVFKITLAAATTSSSYTSNLGFTYSSN
jgi:trimeric autotransporter adhesin